MFLYSLCLLQCLFLPFIYIDIYEVVMAVSSSDNGSSVSGNGSSGSGNGSIGSGNRCMISNRSHCRNSRGLGSCKWFFKMMQHSCSPELHITHLLARKLW